MAEGYKSRHTGAAIDNAVDRVERVPVAEKDKYLHINASSGEPEWSSIVVDDAMSSSSENPVQNKVIKAYVDGFASTALQRKIVVALPTQDIATNVVYMILKQDGEIGDYYNEYMYINNQWELIGSTQMRVDGSLSLVSENPVQNKVVTAALNEKLSKAEFEELSDDLELSANRISGGTDLGSITINEDVWNIPEVTVDNALSDVSENPVQNKVVKGALDTKQETLVSGTNIKTVNGQSVLGSGDIVIKTYSTFSPNWPTSGTMLQLLTAVSQDTSVHEGMSFLGEITCSDMPFNGNAELIINVMDERSSTNKVLWCQLSSNNISPYHWEMTYTSGAVTPWRSYLPKEEFEEYADEFELNVTRVSGAPDLGSITVGTDSWNIPEITVDNALSDVSENPVQNKIVKAALDTKQGTLTAGTGITIDANNVISGSTQITVDSAISSTSENPVQNKVIKSALDLKLSKSEFEQFSESFTMSTDKVQGGTNLGSITIGQDSWNIPDTVVDAALSDVSENPVQNKVVKAALDTKQGTLTAGTGITIDANNVISGSTQITVDSAISGTSENPVQNKVIKAALDLKANASEIDPLSLTVSTTKSSDPSALEAKSFTLDDGTTTTIYNFPDAPVITVDSALSDVSENPVQNKVIKGALDAQKVTVDSALSDVSENPVQNKVIKGALDAQKVTVDNALSASSENPVQNKVIKAALDLKANASEISAMSVVFSDAKSAAAGAIDLKSFTVTQGGVNTIYNLPDAPTITVDDTISPSSTNPVQNQIIYLAFQSVENMINALPTTNTVQSMIDTAIQGAINSNY